MEKPKKSKKAKWTLVYALDLYGSIEIDAESLEEARKKFDELGSADLIDANKVVKIRYLGGCRKK